MNSANYRVVAWPHNNGNYSNEPRYCVINKDCVCEPIPYIGKPLREGNFWVHDLARAEDAARRLNAGEHA